MGLKVNLCSKQQQHGVKNAEDRLQVSVAEAAVLGIPA